MATDAEIRAQGINFLSPQRYLQNPYQLPTEEVVEETGGGIPQTQAFTNSGGDGFSSTGNAFGYGSPVSEVNVRTFNPRSLPGAMTPGGQNANTVYNQAFKDLNDPSLKGMSNDFVGKKAQDVMDYANESIMDYRQNYGAQGQYNSPYEDSIDLGYQGTLGNKGMLNRFKNTIGQAAKFAGGLLPFPLNIATKFLPKGDDNGPGGGTYGIAGLSDDKKAAYNALAGQGYLFGGQQGFKTLTGKNFQATNYVPNQLEMYEKLKDEKELTMFQKKQLQEASAVYKATQVQKEKQENKAAQAAVRETNLASQGKSDPNDQSRTGSSGRRPGSGSGPTQADSGGPTGGYSYDRGGREGFGYGLKEGGRAGYFFGGRVSFKNGGLASIL